MNYYDAMEKESAQQVVKPILDRLVKYTFEHFKREEEAMAAVEYPDLSGTRHCTTRFGKKHWT